MSGKPDYRAIWPFRGPVKHCTLCRRAVASVFISLKEAPYGEQRQHYMCGHCLLTHLLAALDARLDDVELSQIAYLIETAPVPSDPMAEEQARKQRDWKN